ncbi:MAG: amidohydrolase, partial [Rhodospirillales bacterium]|nr:amidohydrolase [Rhodospirillales bacterium]
RLINNEIAECVATHPDRFVGLGSIPLPNTEMAVAELERCVGELGFRGVEINSQVTGDELSAPRLEPFFAKAEELDILIFIHTAGHTYTDRLTEHYFLNIIGHPIEATMAISHLIFDGVMDRHPGLKICVAHGGGYLPSYAGRMDHAYHARPDVRDGLPKPPSEYLKRFYFDTMVFEPDQLKYLIDKFGSDHILLGTDYPYDMGDEDPLGLIGRVAGLDEAAASAIAGGNAAKILKLD